MALDRLVPAMEHGFTLITPAGGSLTLLPGRTAELVRDILALQLELELVRRTKKANSSCSARGLKP